jgi:SAM-dependent methyltransferase
MPAPTAPADAARLSAEFDRLADEYHQVHEANVAITGERAEYFAEYKIADLARLVAARDIPSSRILDFGSGIGNSIPFFRKYFPQSKLHCGDVSSRSLAIAQSRFPGHELHLAIGDEIPLATHSQDIVFSACVFHHIPHPEHGHWLAELRRVTRPGGLLAIYEHNPLNPLTLRAVSTCPLDVNARLITGFRMRRRAMLAGWQAACVDYKLFFPSMLRSLRPLEPHLGWLLLGAQYRLTASKPE